MKPYSSTDDPRCEVCMYQLHIVHLFSVMCTVVINIVLYMYTVARERLS